MSNDTLLSGLWLSDAEFIRRYVKANGELPPAFQRGGLASFGVEYLDLGPEFNIWRLPSEPLSNESLHVRTAETPVTVRSSDRGRITDFFTNRITTAVDSSLFSVNHQLLLPGILSPYQGRVVLPDSEEPVLGADDTNQLQFKFDQMIQREPLGVRRTYPGDWPQADQRDPNPGQTNAAKAAYRGGLRMSRQRAAILRKPEELVSPYAIELALRGFTVECYPDQISLLEALYEGRGRIKVIVIEAPVTDCKAVLDRVCTVTQYNPSLFIWCAERETHHTKNETNFGHTLVGHEESVKMVMRGSIESFRVRLGLIEAWLMKMQLPVLTIQHAVDNQWQYRTERVSYREWNAHRKCDLLEFITDVFVNDLSMTDAGKGLSDHLRPEDLRCFDRLAQATKPVSAADLAMALNNERTASAIPRLVAHLELFGLKEAIRHEGEHYRLDRTVVRVEIEHVRK